MPVRKYVVKSCHDSKSAAKAKQKQMHTGGLTAKIVKKSVKVGSKTKTKIVLIN
jgi:hypothetical protein